MRKTQILIPLLLALTAGSCETRTDRTDSGGVTLSVSDFDGQPIRVAVNDSGLILQVESITIQNVIKDPNGIGSELMNVEMESYEVSYTRADIGTRLPPRLVNNLFGVAPAGGTMTIDGLPVMLAAQFQSVPLADLFFENGGFDKETGSQVVKISLHMRFFGRTLSGDRVESQVASFTVEFVP
jgi:hypothetical protein